MPVEIEFMPEPEEKSLSVSADQLALAQKELGNMAMAVSALRESFKPGTTQVENSEVVVYLGALHRCSDDLAKRLGTSIREVNEVDRLTASLRKANLEIHRIESLAGAAVSPSTVQLGITNLANLMRAWWRKEGFGHISNLSFGENGSLEAELSFQPSVGMLDMLGEEPVTGRLRAAEHLVSLQNRGYVLYHAADRHAQVLDCDRTRKAAEANIMERFPSAYIWNMSSRLITGKSRIENESLPGARQALTSVTIRIRKLEDVKALEQLPYMTPDFISGIY